MGKKIVKKMKQNIRYLATQEKGEIYDRAFQYVATYTKVRADQIVKKLRSHGRARVLKTKDGYDVYYRRPIYPASNGKKVPLRRSVSITLLSSTQGGGFLIGQLKKY